MFQSAQDGLHEGTASKAASEAVLLQADMAFLVEKMPDGVILLDREWRIVFANQNARRISHIEPHHLNGPTHWELYPETVGTAQEEVYRRSMEERISLEHEFYYPPFDV